MQDNLQQTVLRRREAFLHSLRLAQEVKMKKRKKKREIRDDEIMRAETHDLESQSPDSSEKLEANPVAH